MVYNKNKNSSRSSWVNACLDEVTLLDKLTLKACTLDPFIHLVIPLDSIDDIEWMKLNPHLDGLGTMV